MTLTPDDPRHGKASSYTNHKCRCQACRAAWAAYCQEVKARRILTPTPEHVHGTENGYGNYGCRCAECRAAWSAADRARSVRRLERQRREGAA